MNQNRNVLKRYQVIKILTRLDVIQSNMEGIQKEMIRKQTCFRKSERNVLAQNSSLKMFSHFWHLH